ncbi:hypothetical protein H6G89_31695 [Oscillatoria sp. FACHB-1407]|uniref:hypothetical protein n=1 Tax=Oscillatoria sp. FACHB-1407 TaxID=2692847 RepID=UPI0016898A46|nr:hypothetical protein [Oscillatoria sp. FACHB-1407]MBD2465559.1 hypothetical protein [Oscillatoria sp. FACHB-1407]
MEKPTAAAEPTGCDWRDVPNAELNGDRRSDAYAEKRRQSHVCSNVANRRMELVLSCRSLS